MGNQRANLSRGNPMIDKPLHIFEGFTGKELVELSKELTGENLGGIMPTGGIPMKNKNMKTCLRCHNVWEAWVNHEPKKCARCSSPYWNIPRKDKVKCAACGTSWDLVVDHIIPRSKGGAWDKLNYQILCRSCNSKKRSRIVKIKKGVTL
jgi:hypothetical protein